MRSIIRLVAASAVAFPVMIGAAGLASADVEYDQTHVSATADGSTVYDQAAGADDYGNSYAYEQFQAAGPQGAGSWLAISWTYGDSAGHYEHYTWSDTEGAYAGSVSATADGPDYYDDDAVEYEEDLEGDHDDLDDDDLYEDDSALDD
ncbi:hypothetical protein [Saccharothrix sp. HUAS TT1]|uniref:hypothetical protein n=1 Tax=unclassified Saccharothrix TaxID=2593673 RepID=UPI00345C5F3B